MPTDSNGNHTLPPGYLAKTGQTVLASQHNPPLEDLSNSMTGRLPRNGSAPMNANLPMAGFKVTGLGSGTAAGDALTKGQFDAAAVTLAGAQTVTNKTLTSPVINGGTVNTPTITSPLVTGADPWAFQPIGVPVPLLDSLTGAAAPPKDKAYRYVLLTADEGGTGKYNEGILTSESVSGSDPLVSATAVISLTGSPINGQTIRLINTERRFLRAGSAGTVQNDALQDHDHSLAAADSPPSGSARATGQSGSMSAYNDSGRYTTRAGGSGVRTATETRVKNLGVSYYMRVK